MGDRLLAQPHHVFEVVSLGGVGLATLSAHRIVEHQWSLTLYSLSIVKLLLVLGGLSIGRVEVDHISWSEVHVLHIGGLLVSWGEVEVLILIRDRSLEYKLRVRYVGRACVLLLKALILRTRFRLLTLHRCGAISLGIHLRKLLLVC